MPGDDGIDDVFLEPFCSNQDVDTKHFQSLTPVLSKGIDFFSQKG